MKNTNCETCIFSRRYEDSYSSCCEFEIPKLIQDSKDIEITTSKYLKIKNYLCRYGFAQNTHDLYKDQISNIDIKKQILNRLVLRYYLIIDCRDTLLHPESIIKDINIPNNHPKFLSIIVNNDIEAKKYISVLDSIENRLFSYKIHILLEDRLIQSILPMILDVNAKKNHTQYFLIMRPKDLAGLEQYINSIQSILQIYQPDCDFLTLKNRSVSEIFGLFLPFDYYIFLKDKYGSLENATKDESVKVVYYE